MDGRKNNKGTIGNKGGRKPKAEEQKLIEKLTPLEPEALRQLEMSINSGERWAVELFVKYMYGLPKQIVDLNHSSEENTPLITWVSKQDDSE